MILQEMGIGLQVSDDEVESDEDSEAENKNKVTEQDIDELRKEVISYYLV